MILKNFTLSNDHITLNIGDTCFDLHNCYDLSKYQYDFEKACLKVILTKTINQQPKSKSIILLFEDVYFVKMNVKTIEDDYMEDHKTIDLIGFTLKNDISFDSVLSNPEKENQLNLALIIIMESGLALVISAKKVIASTH